MREADSKRGGPGHSGLDEIGNWTGRASIKVAEKNAFSKPDREQMEAARWILLSENLGEIPGILLSFPARKYGEPKLTGGESVRLTIGLYRSRISVDAVKCPLTIGLFFAIVRRFLFPSAPSRARFGDRFGDRLGGQICPAN